MKVFFTSTQAFGEGKRAPDIYVPMDKLLNERIGGNDYGDGLDCWFILFIFQRPDGPNGPAVERTRYWPSKGELDMRLAADHEAWRSADDDERRRLIWDVARRSLGIMRKKKVRDFDVDAFARDVEAVAAEQGWVRCPCPPLH